MATRAQIVQALSKVGIFRDVPHRHLGRVARLMTLRDVEVGEELVREGTFSREFFIVLDGQAAVSVRGRRRDVIGPHDFFGEIAIINRSARTATVRALTPMRIGVISARDLQSLLESEPRLTLAILQQLARRFEDLATRPRGDLR